MSEWTFHGGRLSAARLRFASAPEPWLDLSTGINPHPWPGAAAMEIDWRALPDEAGLRALEAAAAVCFGTSPDFVCALPGTEIGLRLLDTLPLPRPAFHVADGYRTHAEALSGSQSIDAHAIPTRGGRTVLLANPANPDGHIFSTEALLDITQAGGWLIVDEAFADALPGTSVAHHVAEDRPLMVLRSFGKFFGLAGLRLGFAIGPRAMIDRLRARLGSWPVSTAALQIGAAAYADAAWIAMMRQALADEAAALDVVLRRHGFDPRGTCPLFRLIETGHAEALFEHLAGQGILTRPFDHHPRWLRLGLPGSEAALDRLDRALGLG
ncbi:aminotransferase class I/II-fold pyridoxal phosphate-dependent enzyme [Sphingobium boeckii]|uniref:Aminotransferase n=1 Tax=Sphingobium boeckii TaxID=1082345 RepID=A0A7W9AIZ4_9SPHN|nr:aminotransferase class I/II-fold pyridoxal phosphate-dependent enzyme [Sphingobium boeckii]MBB5686505.1 cobalamin biosynthetic protein CobC [Sphingobium boeckii]